MHLQDETKQIEELQERVAEASKKVGPQSPPAMLADPCPALQCERGLGFLGFGV